MNDRGGSTNMPDRQPRHQESRPAAHPVRMQPLTAWKERGNQHPAQKHLLFDSDSYSILSTMECLEACWHVYGNGRETRWLAFLKGDDKVVGFAKLHLGWITSKCGNRLRRLSLVGGGTYESARLNLTVQCGLEKYCA
jgi:hypothetical protein